MQGPEVPQLDYSRIYAYRRRDVLAGGLVWLWVSVMLFLITWVSDFRSFTIDNLAPSPLANSIVSTLCTWILPRQRGKPYTVPGLVGAVFGGFKALYRFYTFLIPPHRVEYDEDQLRLLGIDPSRVPVASPAKAKSTPPSSPLAFRTPTTPHHLPPMHSPSTPTQQFSSPFQYYTPQASPIAAGPGSPLAMPGTPSSPFSPSRGLDRADSGGFRRNSPKPASPSKEFMISDDMTLHRFLAQRDREIRFRDLSGQKQPTSPMGMSPIAAPGASTYGTGINYSPTNLPRYQAAKYADQRAKTPDIVQKKESSESSSGDSALQLYEKLQVAPHIDEWGDNVRLWLHERVLRRCVDWMKSVSDRLGPDVFHQQQIEKVQSGVTSLQNQQSNLFSWKPILPSQQSNPEEKKLLEERMKIERYFGDFGSGVREYVVDRVKELATGVCLSKYRWNSGGNFKGKPWQKEFPTDAQIMMKLFCLYMDELLMPLATEQDHKYDSFTTRYFTKTKGKKTSTLCIVEADKFPPHYNLTVETPEGLTPNSDVARLMASAVKRQVAEWVVIRGRNNLFHCLALFVWYVKVAWQGRFQLIHLGNYDIGLLDVVDSDRSPLGIVGFDDDYDDDSLYEYR